MATRRDKAVEKVLGAIRAKLPKGTARLAKEGSSSDVRSVIPTGIEVVDRYVLGVGGIPAGRIGEVFSDEGAGKTSFGFACLAGAQRAGGVAALIETEKTLELSRAPIFGVDLGELILAEPATFEEVLEAIRAVFDAIPKNVGPNVVVWDSLAATELAGQAGKKVGDSGLVGKRARLMSEALPLLGRLAREKSTAVVIINQIREKIGVVFGPSETTPGGHALKFLASWRFQFWRGKSFKRGTEPAGIHTTVRAQKSKIGLPFRKARLRLDFERGWDNEWSLLEWGKEKKLLGDSARLSQTNLEKIRSALASGQSLDLLGAGDVAAEDLEDEGPAADDSPDA